MVKYLIKSKRLNDILSFIWNNSFKVGLWEFFDFFTIQNNILEKLFGVVDLLMSLIFKVFYTNFDITINEN